MRCTMNEKVIQNINKNEHELLRALSNQSNNGVKANNQESTTDGNRTVRINRVVTKAFT